MKGYKFNDEGEIIKSKITLVWGSPASGKTTYVKNNMKLGDMIIDLDYIKQSISINIVGFYDSMLFEDRLYYLDLSLQYGQLYIPLFSCNADTLLHL